MNGTLPQITQVHAVLNDDGLIVLFAVDVHGRVWEKKHNGAWEQVDNTAHHKA